MKATFIASITAVLLPVLAQVQPNSTSGAICGQKGYDRIQAYAGSSNNADISFAGCKALCVSTNGVCLSFALCGRSCLLYTYLVATNVDLDPTSRFSFYDVTCGDASSPSSAPPSSSASPVSSSETAILSSVLPLSTSVPSVPTSTCSSKTSVCTNSGKPPCDGGCPDLTSDVRNCGTCGHSCESGTTCRSSACAPLPGNCSSYTASCSAVINSILTTNSIASPQLVDYRMQTAILAIASPSDFIATLGPDPCQIYTDSIEHERCVDLLANSQFMSQLSDIVIGVLTSLQTCSSGFSRGDPDYQLIINDPNNATCGGRNGVRKRVNRLREDYDLTQSMLEGIEHYIDIAPAQELGPMKSSSDLMQLVRRQQNTCSRTGVCFERCPDCRNQQTYCGTSAAGITTSVCGAAGATVGTVVGVLIGSACGTACGPGAPVCALFCAAAAGSFTGAAVTGACTATSSLICRPLTERCANCNSANNGICNGDSTQCCAGETGTQCGPNCCCCPRCQAPGGINCACTAAPC